MANFFKKKIASFLTRLIRFILKVVAKEIKYSPLNNNLYNIIKEDSINESFKEFKSKIKKTTVTVELPFIGNKFVRFDITAGTDQIKKANEASYIRCIKRRKSHTPV